MSTPKRHHTVPEFYLRRFAVDGNVQVALRDDLRKSFPQSIGNATVQKHFYSIDTDAERSTEVEAFFANVVEPLGARSIRRIIDEGFFPPAPGLRDQLSTFCAFQFVRGEGLRRVDPDPIS